MIGKEARAEVNEKNLLYSTQIVYEHLRDGPLEKLWGPGGGGEFSSSMSFVFFFNVSLKGIYFLSRCCARIFFSLK